MTVVWTSQVWEEGFPREIAWQEDGLHVRPALAEYIADRFIESYLSVVDSP